MNLFSAPNMTPLLYLLVCREGGGLKVDYQLPKVILVWRAVLSVGLQTKQTLSDQERLYRLSIERSIYNLSPFLDELLVQSSPEHGT
jgi:hypothetical protein